MDIDGHVFKRAVERITTLSLRRAKPKKLDSGSSRPFHVGNSPNSFLADRTAFAHSVNQV